MGKDNKGCMYVCDLSFEATQSKTNGSHGKGKKSSSSHNSVNPKITDESDSDAFEDELQLPGNLEKKCSKHCFILLFILMPPLPVYHPLIT